MPDRQIIEGPEGPPGDHPEIRRLAAEYYERHYGEGVNRMGIREHIIGLTHGEPPERKCLPGSDEKWAGYLLGVEEAARAAESYDHPRGAVADRVEVVREAWNAWTAAPGHLRLDYANDFACFFERFYSAPSPAPGAVDPSDEPLRAAIRDVIDAATKAQERARVAPVIWSAVQRAANALADHERGPVSADHLRGALERIAYPDRFEDPLGRDPLYFDWHVAEEIALAGLNGTPFRDVPKIQRDLDEERRDG